MKKNLIALFVTASVLVLCVSCNTNSGGSSGNNTTTGDTTWNPEAKKNARPVMTFEEDFHDFGKIITGEKVTHSFKFKNTGKSALLISSVGTSCGCTVSDYPKKPILPNEGATIDVSFNSEGKLGLQTKVITVFTNATPPESTLRIQALVLGSEKN